MLGFCMFTSSSTSCAEIHWPVAGMLSNQPTNNNPYNKVEGQGGRGEWGGVIQCRVVDKE